MNALKDNSISTRKLRAGEHWRTPYVITEVTTYMFLENSFENKKNVPAHAHRAHVYI
jgi:hypothetical protein